MFYVLDEADNNTFLVLDTDDSSVDQLSVMEIGEFVVQGYEIKGVSYSNNGDLKVIPLSVSNPCLEAVEDEDTGRTYLKYCIHDVGTFVREMKSLYISKESIKENAYKYGFDPDYIMKYFK